jgi:hypothetical protein
VLCVVVFMRIHAASHGVNAFCFCS